MEKFDKHFKMEETDAIEYAKCKLNFFEQGAVLNCKEIGDGNINYIFRIKDEMSGKSVIIKQADVQTRSTKSALDTDHNRIEMEILKQQAQMAPGAVPEVYFYDPVMCCVVMEDLFDYENMRTAMLEYKIFDTFAQDITKFLVNVLIRSTDLVMHPKDKKALVKRFINPALCDISERLVFTNPYKNPSGRNMLFPENREFLEKELYEDEKLHLEIAKMKIGFMSKAQSLLHGDLHTGSILIKQGSTMVLDPEFAFYGPAGYDIGNVIAHLIFAWVHAEVTLEDTEKNNFQNWVETSLKTIIDEFQSKAVQMIKDEAIDPIAHTDGFAEWYVDDILADTAGITGAELNRRVIGSAKVADITSIEDAVQRVRAERICVRCGKRLIMGRDSGFRSGADYIALLHESCVNVGKE